MAGLMNEVPESLRGMVGDEARWNAARRESLGCARAVLLAVASTGLLVGVSALVWLILEVGR